MSSPVLSLSRDEARWIAVAAQGLDRRPFRRRPTKADLLATIRAIEYVQLDTISVISRSHETVLWSRLGPYDPSLIADLYDPDHAITEYWAHAAAIIPLDLLPLFRGYMEKRRTGDDWRLKPENVAAIERLRGVMRDEGPVSSLDFDAPEDATTHEWDWYGKKPERAALGYMWTHGDAIVRRRDGFRRVFDLPEHIIPGFWDGEAMPEQDVQRELGLRAVRALGVMTPNWLANYFRSGGPVHLPMAAAKQLLPQFEREGIVTRIEVPGIAGPTWIDTAQLPRLDDLRSGRSRPTLTTLLSPFDNLTWNRQRGETLWDFPYRIEVYTPAPKRVYGYYSLPILHRGRIVGRLDPSFDRKTKVLTIKALHLEPHVKATPALGRAIAGAIQDLLRFLGGDPDAWRLLQANPPEILPLITGAGDEARADGEDSAS
ncbi:MAG: crosslink repair DNA glycosylase YcaQ family protein [Thermomicrobiales bacterium]